MIFSATVKALAGRRRWLRIKRRHDIEKNGIYVILMPDDDRELNEIALRHIDDFLDYRKGRAAVIITTQQWVFDNAQNYSGRIAAIELVTQRNSNLLIFYSYNDYNKFSEQFTVISLQGIHGRRLALAEGVNNITKEDMVCLSMYLIRNWTAADR